MLPDTKETPVLQLLTPSELLLEVKRQMTLNTAATEMAFKTPHREIRDYLLSFTESCRELMFAAGDEIANRYFNEVPAKRQPKPDVSEYRIDTRIIAQKLGIQHENVVGTINKYLHRFNGFGILRFETGEIIGRGQPQRFALLNENQCYFLATLSRNTDRVVDFKEWLVREFSKHRAAPTSSVERLESRIDEVVARQVIADENYFTVAGWYALHGKPVTLVQASTIGKLCKAASLRENYPVGDAHSDRFGKVHTYHREILSKVICI